MIESLSGEDIFIVCAGSIFAFAVLAILAFALLAGIESNRRDG